MRATIVFLVMILLPVAGMLAIIFGAFLLITKVKWGRTPAIISISAGCVCMLLFAGTLLFLRHTNGQPEEGYIDTGVMVEWQGETFTYQDVKYVPVYDDNAEEVFSYFPAIEESGLEVAFNIKPKTNLLDRIFNANYEENVYRIDSGEGTTLYYNYFVFCPESKKEHIREYYEQNRNWSIVMNSFSEDEYEIPIDLTADEEKLLGNINDLKSTKISTSEIRMDADLKFTTSDGVLEGVTGLCFDGEKWYWDTDEVEEDSSGEEVVYIVCELPELLNEKLTYALESVD